MGERFNATGRDCPWCWRRGSLVLSLDGSGLLECGGGEPLRSFPRDRDGCGVRFRVDGADLVRVREPAFEYRPPIETVCAHGKTLGPCPICSETYNREQRAARRGP